MRLPVSIAELSVFVRQLGGGSSFRTVVVEIEEVIYFGGVHAVLGVLGRGKVGEREGTGGEAEETVYLEKNYEGTFVRSGIKWKERGA